MNNQIFALNASALFAGFKAIESGAKFIFGNDSRKERSDNWQSISTSKGYVSAFSKTVQLVIGSDSLCTRIGNFAKACMFTAGSYLLADISRDVSKAQMSVSKMTQDIQVAFGKTSSADAHIEAAHSNNLLANIDAFFCAVQDLTLGCNDAKASFQKCTQENVDIKQKFAGLQEEAKCSQSKKELETALLTISTQNVEITQLDTERKAVLDANTAKDALITKVSADLQAALKTALTKSQEDEQTKCPQQAINLATCQTESKQKDTQIAKLTKSLSKNANKPSVKKPKK